MPRLEALRGDLAVLRRMLGGMPRAASHAAALSRFYAPQALDYDRFRERLLRGRAELIARVPLPGNAHVVELGGGTGRNAEFFGDRLKQIAALEIVDLCAPLLVQAHKRARTIAPLRVIEADATTYRPARPVDCVYFSYALTMIPDWRRAITNAISMLKPGGVLGAVDFHVSSPKPDLSCVRHDMITRAFWPAWFGHDGVRLDPQHLSTLRRLLPDHDFTESRAAVPFLPFGKVPYYVFVGRV
ncbi:MAG TPA: class I SAM-dependent methyltransferase [Rhodanobacteraceae bacterium]|jgi:S-adenosylmethionine-diacylgycerolhomoserine-N-methlytransferase|nr:class I SAM-dependent methyltransferase [Rhodanobacteraceae bacterium]